MSIEGVLVDLDGTLIDSNHVHALAWLEAMRRHGYAVAVDRIAEEIGKGGDHLVADVLGRSADRVDGERLRNLHGVLFSKLAAMVGLPVAPGAETLLAGLRDRHIKIALATSSSAEQLEVAERCSGVPWRELVDEVVDADDVASSKPDADVVHAALRKLHMSAAQCALIGDTRWDAQAATKAGVVTLGLTFGGEDAYELRRAGARLVYHDLTEVCARLDPVLHTLGPPLLSLGPDAIAEMMRHAIAVAEEALIAGELPIGALHLRDTGEVIGRGRERVNELGDRLRHAAVGALAGDATPGSVLVSTLEPCAMCTGAAIEVGVDTILYGMPIHDGGARLVPSDLGNTVAPRVVGGVLADRVRQLFVDWLQRPKHNTAHEPWVRALLGDHTA